MSSGRRLLPLLNSRARVQPRLMCEAYEAILAEIMRRSGDVFSSRPTISVYAKVKLGFKTWLRKQFLKVKEKNTKFPKKIYINRKDSVYDSKNIRKIINENEVIEYLEKKGFVSIVLSELSFKDQIKLFSYADFITGLHGAGYANIVFCNPNTKILELKPNSSGDVIKNLSKNVELRYNDISIKPSINDLQNQSGQIIIPLSILEDKINFN